MRDSRIKAVLRLKAVGDLRAGAETYRASAAYKDPTRVTTPAPLQLV